MPKKKLTSFLKSLAGGFTESLPDRGASDPAASVPNGNKRWSQILARGNVPGALKAAMDIDGALGVALVDYNSGLALGIDGGGQNLDLEVAAAGNAEVVKAKMKTMSELGLDDRIEDIGITLGAQVHLIRAPRKRRRRRVVHIRSAGQVGQQPHRRSSRSARHRARPFRLRAQASVRKLRIPEVVCQVSITTADRYMSEPLGGAALATERR